MIPKIEDQKIDEAIETDIDFWVETKDREPEQIDFDLESETD